MTFEKYSKPNCVLPSYIEVKESTIPNSGSGVFAMCDIPANTVIGEYIGKVYTGKGITDNQNSEYVYEVYKNGKVSKIIDGQFKKYSSWPRYINTCQTDNGCNAVYYQYDQRIFVRTRKLIPAGQEIFAYYGYNYVNDNLKKYFTKENKPVIRTKKTGKKC
jgi:hypothetical protein